MVSDPGQVWGMTSLAPAAEDTDPFSLWSMRCRERNIQPLKKRDLFESAATLGGLERPQLACCTVGV